MVFALTLAQRLARARTDLRAGLPVVVRDSDRAVLICAAETLGQGLLETLTASWGDWCIAITARRADTLKARAYDGDIARIVPPKGADAAWVQALADPAGDLSTPLKGPFLSMRGGSAELHRAGILLAKSARLLPVVVVGPAPDDGLSALTHLSAADVRKAVETATVLEDVVQARLPIAQAGPIKLHVFRPDDGGEEHYAIEVGIPARDRPVLTRLHSACFTGDILGSLKCDCGPQLHGAIAAMSREGAGVLLYLNQEGRGIGLANKMRAYFLQNQGFDTVEANHRLGFEDDERDFRIGASLLSKLGFSSVRLLTNNPAKVAMLEGCGVAVTERVPLQVGRNPLNADYLDTKAHKSGHLL